MTMDYEAIVSGTPYPSCSMSFNGVRLEEAVPGYMTHSVEGRDSLSQSLDEISFKTGDGSIYKSRKHTPRTITVSFGIVSNSAERHRKQLNDVRRILYGSGTEECMIVFDDEPDVYFKGTVSNFKETKFVGNYSSEGEITIYCADPFKYSITEYTALPDANGEFVINYDGSYRSYPVLKASMASEDEAHSGLNGYGDCGYIAFMNDREKVIQIGDPDEQDKDDNTKSETIVNQKFTSYDANVSANWVQNAGINSNPSEHLIRGTIGAKQYGGGTLLSPLSYGSGTKWHGPSVRRSFESCTDWRLQFKAFLACCYSGVATITQVTQYYQASSSKSSAPSTWATSPVTITSSNKYLWNYTKITYSDNTVSNCTPHVIAEWKGWQIEEVTEYYATNNINVAPVDGSFGTDVLTTDTTNAYLWNYKKVSYLDSGDEDFDRNKADTKTQKYLIDEFRKDGVDRTGADRNQSQRGVIQVTVAQGTSLIACMALWKADYGNKATARFYLAGAGTIETSFDASEFNMNFGWTRIVNGKTVSVPVRECKINKKGNTFVFKAASYARTMTSSVAGAMNADNVTIWFGSYGSSPVPLGLVGVEYCKFIKDHYATFEDIPNKLSMNDEVEADCSKAEIKLNGMPSPELGAVGNDWEGFYLSPGVNQIATAYSDWVVAGYEPEFEITYRKVYL